MKKTLHIDEKLLQDARTVSRAATDTETVRMGLEALILLQGSDFLRRILPTRPALLFQNELHSEHQRQGNRYPAQALQDRSVEDVNHILPAARQCSQPGWRDGNRLQSP